MATSLEELRVLRETEAVADAIWRQVVQWDPFAREVVGGQLARAADSVGANIAEAFGRFHYGEKLQFLYYARGSLFETKYWLNRALARNLMETSQVQAHASRLTDVARQLNAFARSLKAQRRGKSRQSKAIREPTAEYTIETEPFPLFTKAELEWLQTVQISNL
jgi:four helix bundle protein